MVFIRLGIREDGEGGFLLFPILFLMCCFIFLILFSCVYTKKGSNRRREFLEWMFSYVYTKKALIGEENFWNGCYCVHSFIVMFRN